MHSKTKNCRAMVFREVGQPLSLDEVSIPSLRYGEVLVRVTCCTICGSDIHTYSGDRQGSTPSILGHEIIGVVEDLGSDNIVDVPQQSVRVGDRVTWSVAASCHCCQRCKEGMPQKCDSLFKYGHERLTDEIGPNGGLAEYCLLKSGSSIVLLPADVSDEVLCPANCATATVAAAVRTAGSLRCKRVLIFGAGMLGLTATAFAKTLGADEIFVCDLDHSRCERAKDFGATGIGSEPDGKFDAVFELSGSPVAVESAIANADLGGTVVLVGSVFPTRTAAVDPEHVVRQLLSIHGVHNYRPEDLSTAVAFLNQHHTDYPFSQLVEKTFPLDQANEAFAYAVEQRPIRVAIVP